MVAKLDLYKSFVVNDREIVIPVDGLSDPIVYDVYHEVSSSNNVVYAEGKKYEVLDISVDSKNINLDVREIV